MKISTKGRYGLRAIVDLAAHAEGEVISLNSIAVRQKLSLNYLEQVFGTLRKAGIVNSIKGSGGGYLLVKDADHITVREVLEALEGAFAIVDTETLNGEPDAVEQAIQELIWSEIDQRVNALLESCTIAQLAKEYRQLQRGEAPMYYI